MKHTAYRNQLTVADEVEPTYLSSIEFIEGRLEQLSRSTFVYRFWLVAAQLSVALLFWPCVKADGYKWIPRHWAAGNRVLLYFGCDHPDILSLVRATNFRVYHNRIHLIKSGDPKTKNLIMATTTETGNSHSRQNKAARSRSNAHQGGHSGVALTAAQCFFEALFYVPLFFISWSERVDMGE